MLADFGVARWLGQTSELTGTDMTVGTITYAAPEQLKGEAVDGKADQYALAATAYHLITGSAPFVSTNPTVVISQHLSAPPPKAMAGHPELARFAPVFARALAKDPKDRFDRCGDFAAALQAALDRTTAPPRRRWGAAGLGALMLAGAAVAAAVLLSGQHREPPAPKRPAPPPAVSARMDLPVVVIGAECAVLGAAAVDATNADAYCAHADNGAQVWSSQPERLRPAAP